jgi:hypothetical protein
VTLQDPEGKPYQVLPDYHTAEAMRHTFIGNAEGLLELERLLHNNETELKAVLDAQNNTNSVKE